MLLDKTLQFFEGSPSCAVDKRRCEASEATRPTWCGRDAPFAIRLAGCVEARTSVAEASGAGRLAHLACHKEATGAAFACFFPEKNKRQRRHVRSTTAEYGKANGAPCARFFPESGSNDKCSTELLSHGINFGSECGMQHSSHRTGGPERAAQQ
jgi:hypothetical protein